MVGTQEKTADEFRGQVMRCQEFGEITSHIYGRKVIQQTFAEYPQDVNGCAEGTERVCPALMPEWCHQQGKTGRVGHMGFFDHSVALGPFSYNTRKASHTRTRYVGVPCGK